MKKKYYFYFYSAAILLILLSQAIPLGAFLYKELRYKNLYTYYYEADTMEICLIQEKKDKNIQSEKRIQEIIEKNLLTPLQYTLAHNYENVQLIGLNVLDTLLILNFSREYFQLSAQNERRFMAALLLNIQNNFPFIEKLAFYVESQPVNFLHGLVYYGKPFLLRDKKEIKSFFLELADPLQRDTQQEEILSFGYIVLDRDEEAAFQLKQISPCTQYQKNKVKI